jgi:hypothetical protein
MTRELPATKAVRILYKPFGILSAIIGGIVATQVFRQIWRRADPGHHPDAPKALESEYGLWQGPGGRRRARRRLRRRQGRHRPGRRAGLPAVDRRLARGLTNTAIHGRVHRLTRSCRVGNTHDPAGVAIGVCQAVRAVLSATDLGGYGPHAPGRRCPRSASAQHGGLETVTPCRGR